MVCKCIETVNLKLIAHNTEISVPLMSFDRKTGKPVNPEKCMIETRQIAHGRGKQKALSVSATFCPFCGTRYDPEPEPEEHDKQVLDAAQAMGVGDSLEKQAQRLDANGNTIPWAKEHDYFMGFDPDNPDIPTD